MVLGTHTLAGQINSSTPKTTFRMPAASVQPHAFDPRRRAANAPPISLTPNRIAQKAMRSSRASAVTPGQISAMRPASTETTPWTTVQTKCGTEPLVDERLRQLRRLTDKQKIIAEFYIYLAAALTVVRRLIGRARTTSTAGRPCPRPAGCADTWCGTRSPRLPHCPGGAIKSTVLGVRLMDRGAEKQALHEVLDSVRRGMSGALVLRGEPGVGKSALLGDVMEHAGDLQIVRTVAVESEMTLAFAAIHQLLSPLLPGANRLPEPQRRALSVAFGLVSGPPADPFLVGLAVLTLLADAADAWPVLCLVDDAQWLDEESADILGFVAGRLLADGVGMVFALRETTEPNPRLQALPGLRVAGLPEPDAYELLQTSISRPIDASVAARIVVETGGNPLAVVEAARELAPEQLGGLNHRPIRCPWVAARRPVRAACAGAAGGHAEAALAGGGGPAGPRCSLDCATSV